MSHDWSFKFRIIENIEDMAFFAAEQELRKSCAVTGYTCAVCYGQFLVMWCNFQCLEISKCHVISV